MKRKGNAQTVYSEKWPGDAGNDDREICFDLTDGYLGITTWVTPNNCERVLLSPTQVQALKGFIANRRKR